MQSEAHSTINELAAQYGVSYRTLRFYEDLELLSPHRVGTSRYYTSKDKTRLELIIKAKKLGFSLREIWRLLHEAPEASSNIEAIMSKDEIFVQLAKLENRSSAIKAGIAELRAALAARSF